MKHKEILYEIKSLGLYTPEEWKEYLSHFSARNEDLNYPINHTESFLSRIKQCIGANPAKVDPSISPKIITIEDLSAKKLKEGLTLGVVSGCYDLLHLGHVRSMSFAKQYLSQYENPKLVALVLSDENIRIKKGATRPILDINERLEMICALNSVDFVIPLVYPNCLDALDKLRPNYFFKGSADRTQDIVRREMELVEKNGGELVVFPKGQGKSRSTTTLINEALEKLMREF
jgi:D-glycero-beta-D-manno-heptose 1-phosphate adenylyltransferase